MCPRPPASGLLYAALLMLPAPMLRGQETAIPPEWEARREFAALVEQAQRLKPLLDAVQPAGWQQKGAPDTYIAQWKSLQSETGYVVRALGELEKEPERLTLALETYFRMESLEAVLASLNEGVRKYQNPALADLLQGAMIDGAPGREKLKQYVIKLTALREEQFRIADQEAQRCRARLLQQAPPKTVGAPK